MNSNFAAKFIWACAFLFVHSLAGEIILFKIVLMDLTNSRRKNSPQLLIQFKHKYISIFAFSANTFQSLLYQQIHFNQIKLKMAANNMSNIHVSPNVLSTLILLQQGKLYKLQQQIMHGIFKSSRPEVFCKKAAVKTYAKFTGKHQCCSLFSIKLQAFRSATSLKTDSNKGVFL